ncbi:hypothetical protein Bbelb_370110 [Branchiostoma belcheri]|nr:hypothetical protein Bbelb_370110 [Branchiostoma belcheri]
MAEDLNSKSVPSVVRNDSSSDNTTEPGTRTVPPTVRQTDEDINNYISGTCEENEHDDDKHVSIRSGSAFENRETIHISPGDFDTYAIAYTCKAQDTRIKKNVEETKSKPFQGSKTTSSSNNENDIHLAECGPVQNYTDTFNGNDDDVNPDRVYTHVQSTIEPYNASPGGDIPCTLTSADTHQQDDANMCQDNLECNAALSDTQPKLPSQDLPSAAPNDINDVLSNPLSNINGVLNALNPNPIYVPNVQNSAACDLPPIAVKYVTYFTCKTIDYSRSSEQVTNACHAANQLPQTLTLTTPPLHDAIPTVPLSCVSSVSAFSAVSNTSQREVTQKWRDDYRCGDGYTTGDGRTAECDPDSTWPCCSSGNWCGNTAGHCDCAGCVDYRNTESGDRKLENIITIGGDGKEPDMTAAYGVAVSADNEIFVTDAVVGVLVFSINGNSAAFERHCLPGHLWVVGGIVNSGGNEGHVQVVTYSRIGQAIKTFDVGFTGPFILPVIAIDVRNNKIIVGQGKTVKMFDPDGSLYRIFKASSGSERGMIGGVISDSEGNILLTFFNSAFKAVAMYSHSGVKIVEFAGRVKGQLDFVFYGIFRDKLGNIIVADKGNNRVDMFTNRGEFIRTIANIRGPIAIAMGPDGEMVVTTSGPPSTVTIFPRHTVLP